METPQAKRSPIFYEHSNVAEFQLGDYIPRDSYLPGVELGEHMEAQRAQGREVYLVSEEGFLLIVGYPDCIRITGAWAVCVRGMPEFNSVEEALNYD